MCLIASRMAFRESLPFGKVFSGTSNGTFRSGQNRSRLPMMKLICFSPLSVGFPRPPRSKEADSLTCQRDCSPLAEKETNTGANQVLPQIATLVGIDLGARVIEVVVFNKSTKVRIEKVICAGDHLPRQVR